MDPHDTELVEEEELVVALSPVQLSGAERVGRRASLALFLFRQPLDFVGWRGSGGWARKLTNPRRSLAVLVGLVIFFLLIRARRAR